MNFEKKSAIFYAAEKGFDKVVRFLSEKGADLNIKEKEEGNTAVMTAVTKSSSH